MSNEIWAKLCTEEALRNGWHLTRTDTQTDFIEEPFAKETFAYFVDENIRELLRALQIGDFQPHPLTRVSIPKGTLATRPGTLLSLEDRVILFAALKLIAEPIDKQLIAEVYSYRVKKERNKSSLFYEGDAISLPFLKSQTVKKYIDPFDPWYGLWPKFDAISRQAFEGGEYRFMATSDIAAYFENIQLDILRDHLNDLLPGEQKIINLFITSFSAWTYDTAQGRRYQRGIPQGSQISSFFGNIFLKPIDEAFASLRNALDIKYYRYMDDIRIFTKSYRDARAGVLLLDSEIRRIHLNLQTAKTRIYDEKDGEISTALIDRRLAQLEKTSADINSIRQDAKKAKKELDFLQVREALARVLDAEPNSSAEQKISRARKPLRGLSDRVFRRMLTQHLAIGSDALIKRLIKELQKNADFRLGEKLIRHAQLFPRKNIQADLLNFIQSQENVMPFQEAQILKAFRYQSRIAEEVRAYVLEKVANDQADTQVRVQGLQLIARTKTTRENINTVNEIFEKAAEIAIKKAAMLVLMRKRGKDNANFVQKAALHPHDSVRKMGKLLRAAKNDKIVAENLLGQAFKQGDT